jgi:hypothetical protein
MVWATQSVDVSLHHYVVRQVLLGQYSLGYRVREMG